MIPTANSGIPAGAPAGRVKIAVLFLVLTAACGPSDSDSGRTIRVDDREVSVALLQEAARALCTGRDQAQADVKQAFSTFYDRSHDVLHTIASALEPVDRAAAARLLEQKQRVEEDLQVNAPGPQLAADLDRLATVTRTGLAALDIPVDPCS